MASVLKDEKQDLPKFAPCKYVANIYAGGKDRKCLICLVIYTPSILECKCAIYHLCHIFTHQYLHICDIYARSKFVQIYLILSMLNSSCIACILGTGKAP